MLILIIFVPKELQKCQPQQLIDSRVKNGGNLLPCLSARNGYISRLQLKQKSSRLLNKLLDAKGKGIHLRLCSMFCM